LKIWVYFELSIFSRFDSHNNPHLLFATRKANLPPTPTSQTLTMPAKKTSTWIEFGKIERPKIKAKHPDWDGAFLPAKNNDSPLGFIFLSRQLFGPSRTKLVPPTRAFVQRARRRSLSIVPPFFRCSA
jgi:hypothetical protein